MVRSTRRVWHRNCPFGQGRGRAEEVKDENITTRTMENRDLCYCIFFRPFASVGNGPLVSYSWTRLARRFFRGGHARFEQELLGELSREAWQETDFTAI